jgi:signal transduction histidine kinase
LAANAMKFTDDGYVMLSVELVDLHPDNDYASPRNMNIQHLLFRVVDTGLGMDADTRFKLFQRFYQGQSRRVRNYTHSACAILLVL